MLFLSCSALKNLTVALLCLYFLPWSKQNSRTIIFTILTVQLLTINSPSCSVWLDGIFFFNWKLQGQRGKFIDNSYFLTVHKKIPSFLWISNTYKTIIRINSPVFNFFFNRLKRFDHSVRIDNVNTKKRKHYTFPINSIITSKESHLI